MFSLNEKVVYPGHGVAKINRIVEKRVGGQRTSFFELKFLHSEMTILVPTENLESVGIRKVSSNETIEKAFKILAEPARLMPNMAYMNNWSKRNKEYQCKLRTGDLFEICAIYRDLNFLSTQKDLSFGEKGLLHKIESLLAEEISIVSSIKEDQAVAQLRAQCCIPKHSTASAPLG